MKSRIAIIAAVVLASALSAAAQDSWRDLGAAGTFQNNDFVSGANGRFYWFGGYGDNAAAHGTQIYDPVTSAWTNTANFPQRNLPTACASATLNGIVYFMGGWTNWPNAVGSCYSFNLATNAWADLPSLTVPRSAMAAIAWGNRIYAMGGADGDIGPSRSTVEIFDVQTQTWSTGPSLPLPTSYAWCGACQDRVIFGGGWDDNDYTSSVYELNTTAAVPAWVATDSMPNGAFGGGRASAAGRAFAMFSGNPIEYDPSRAAGSKWIVRAPSTDTLPFWAIGDGVNINGKVLFLGWDGGANTDRLFCEYTPVPNGATPAAPAALKQRIPGGALIPANGALTGASVEFEAQVGDPDAGQFVGIEVEVQPLGAAFRNYPNVDGALGAQGIRKATVTGLAENHYRWQARSFDQNDNRSAWVAFGSSPATADYTIDRTPPTGIVPVSPNGGLAVTGGGPVTFRWTPGNDALLIASYDIEASTDPNFLVGGVGTTFIATQGDLAIPAVSAPFYWHVRGTDAAGNVSPWSTVAMFQVTAPIAPAPGDDAKKDGCGQGVPTDVGPCGVGLLVAALAIGLAARRN